jgi:hypothetical protein
MDTQSGKPTGQQLLAQLNNVKEDAETFKELWQGYLDIPLPPDFEIRNAVRRLNMADLVEGMQSFATAINRGESDPTTKRAMNYICGTAWKIAEQENPEQQFQPTARRQRNARRDPDSLGYEAYENARPEERQRIVAENIAKQRKQKKKGKR